MAEKKLIKEKAKSSKKASKQTKKPSARMRKPKSANEVQHVAEDAKSQAEIQQAVEQTKSQTEIQQVVEEVKPREITSNVNEEKTPFTIEIITGFLSIIALGLFQQTLVIPFILLILFWRFVLKKSIASIAGAFLITLATSSVTLSNPYEYLFIWILIGAVILTELNFQVVLPIRRGRSLSYSSVLETTFFYVAGVVISYIIQMSFCGVSLIANGTIDLLKIQTQILECQFQGTNIALVCVQWVFTSAIFWGSLFVALRRVNFDPQNFKRLPSLFLRALFGVIITVLFSAAINTIKIYFAERHNLPQIVLVTYSYLYTVMSIILASIGASFVTKRFTNK